MIKVMALLTRKPELSLEEFDSHWHRPHGDPLTLNIEGIRHYVQCTRAGEADELSTASFDGVPQVWLDDLAAAAGLQEAPGYEEANADQVHFMDIPKLQFLLTDEDSVDGDGGPGEARGVDVLRFLRRRDGMSPEEFAGQWRDDADREQGQALGATRHIRSVSIPESYAEGTEPPFDGVRELWFSDIEAVRRAREQSPEAWEALINPAYADPDRSVTLVSTQRRLR